MGVRITTNGHPTVDRLARQLAAHGIPAEATDIYKGRNRVVRLDTDGETVNIKQFRIPHAINRLVYGNLRRSKARRAYENAGRLLALGLPTPAPLAYVEHREGLRFGLSYFVSEQLEGYEDIRRIAESEHRTAIVDAVGRLMADLHRAHIFMKDFSQGNVLWRADARGHIELSLVDINRMAFGVHSTRRLMKNFRTVTDDPALLAEIAQAYARASGMPPEEALRRAQRARRLYLLKRRLKKLLK